MTVTYSSSAARCSAQLCSTPGVARPPSRQLWSSLAVPLLQIEMRPPGTEERADVDAEGGAVGIVVMQRGGRNPRDAVRSRMTPILQMQLHILLEALQ
jgi:hypothetical protein